MAAKARGFTLVEMIVVIVIMAIAITGVSVALFPKSRQSAEQVLAVKAAELGRAVMDEILGRKFDQNSGPNGGLPECVLELTAGRELCTAPQNLGADGEASKSEYDDVDDYSGINGSVFDVLDESLDEISYQGFRVVIDVKYEQDDNGEMSVIEAEDTITHYKRIEVTIIDRQGNHYPFAATRGNY